MRLSQDYILRFENFRQVISIKAHYTSHIFQQRVYKYDNWCTKRN